MDRYTEVTHTSYGENITNSFKGIIFGLLLLIGSIVLLVYNEKRSINQVNALEEMQANLITLHDTKYDIQYEKKPVLLQGEVIPKKVIEDTLFDLNYTGLVLERVVKMYQWKEKEETKTEDEVGGSTTTTKTYTYEKTWASSPINSSLFRYPEGHENPTSMPYRNERFVTDAHLGDYYLNNYAITKFGTIEDNQLLANLPKTVNQTTNYHTYLYRGKDPQAPQVGDLKIHYRVVPQGIYSLAGMVQGSAIVPYVTQYDRSFLFVRHGLISAEQIFQEEFQSNTILTWILRATGLLLMFGGFILIMGPLATLVNVIPALGFFVGGMTAIVATVLTLILGSVVIALAWFGSRPIFSLTVIGIGFALAFGINQMKKGKQSNSQTSQATPPPRRK